MFKNWKLILFSTVVFVATLLHCCAQAEPFVCFNETASASEGLLERAVLDDSQGIGVWLEPTSLRPQCSSLKHLGTGLNATALIFSGTGLALACTGVGAPATVWLEGGAIGLQALQLVVGELPCEDRAQDQQIKALAKQVVCEQLSAIGVACRL